MSSRRRRARSPAVTPLDDDDLLCEILLRLPQHPSSLPRASAVSKRWRRLVSDPGFFRRFRLHHRRNPPLLGFMLGHLLLPTLEAPNRVPPGRFSPSPSRHGAYLGCRHGLVLIHLSRLCQVMVWDPVTGDKHRIDIPAVPFDTKDTLISGTVLRAAGAGEAQCFQVVLAGADGDEGNHRRAFACVYSSETGSWGNLIATPIPYQANGSCVPTSILRDDAVLIGDSLYWKLGGNLWGILEFDLVKQSLAVVRAPLDLCGVDRCSQIMRADGGGLGVLLVSDSDCTAQLWKRKTDDDGVTSWGLGRTIGLHKLLSLKPEDEFVEILGYAEVNNVVLLWTYIGLFMVHLESLKFKKLLEIKDGAFSRYLPFESVYTTEICAGGGHDGVELLRNT